MQSRRLRWTTLTIFLPVCLLGCGREKADDESTSLDQRMAHLIAEFEHVENNFGTSTTIPSLIRNSHWLSRMIACLKEIGNVDRQRIARGADPMHDVRQDLEARLAGYIESLESDMRKIDDVSQEDLTKVWLDL